MDMNLTGKTIAKLRKAAGFTQASLAEKLGISDKAVSKWERGIACPDVALWNALSILLDTDIESLIYGHDGESEWKGILFLDSSIAVNTTIYNKPLIHYILSQFLLVGITDITIIGECGELGFPGISIEVKKDLNQQFTSNAMIIYGNSFLYGPNLTKHFKRAMSRKEEITVLAAMKRKGEYQLSVDKDKRAVFRQAKQLNPYYAEPIVFVPQGNSVKSTFEAILQTGSLNAETMIRGMLSFRVNTYDEAYHMSEFVQLMENKTGERIGCIEEILIRRGIVGYEDVKKFCDKETGRYLEELFNIN